MTIIRPRLGAALARLLLGAWVFVGGHASASAQYRPGVPVALLLVAGPFVTVNGRPAENGMTIRSSDRVVTGPSSSAMIDFYAGGSVQLDANTDPEIFGAFAGYVGCWIRIYTGQSYTEGEGQSTCFGSGAERILSQSAFNLQIAPGGELLTVTAGAVTVTGAQPITVPRGSQVSIASGGRITSQRFLSPAELQQITAWRGQYRFVCLLYTSPSPRDLSTARMPSSA